MKAILQFPRCILLLLLLVTGTGIALADERVGISGFTDLAMMAFNPRRAREHTRDMATRRARLRPLDKAPCLCYTARSCNLMQLKLRKVVTTTCR